MPPKRRGPGDVREPGAAGRARVGRPKMQDGPVSKTDEDALRKERIRLAQRTYRNRREVDFNRLKGKVETLELALGKIIKSFTKFQNFAIESGGLPPDVALALSRTGLEIMNHSNEARDFKIEDKEQGDRKESGDATKDPSSESNGNQGISGQASTPQPGTSLTFDSQPSTPLFPWTSAHHHHNLLFAQKLRLACVERGLQLLSTPNLSLPEIHPALSLHLKSMSVAELRLLTEESLLGGPYSATQAPVLIHPDMYRKIEGSEDVVVKRTPSRDVERLVFGLTRTVVETAMPGFEGEWLEPRDVEEYLEEKGVQVGSTELTTILHLSIPETDLRPSTIDMFDIQPSVHTINLQKLVEYLALSAICIGPGPGMRRDDVDKALEHCIVGFWL